MLISFQRLFETGFFHNWDRLTSEYYFDMYRGILDNSGILGARQLSDLYADPIPKYEPLSNKTFKSLLLFIGYCFTFALIVLLSEILYKHVL